MAAVRLQKFLSECGVASRRRAEEMISAGKVKVNGKVVSKLGTKIDPAKDRVQVGNRAVGLPEKGLLLFYKPRGVISTLYDPEGRKSIGDFLTKKYESYFPVGRLDWDSSGLVVLTNDGELADRLMHPRYELDRCYEVRVEGSVSEATIERIRKGILLTDGKASAEAQIVETEEKSTYLTITVREGRNRLIRRIMDKVRHPVIKLKRISHGPFRIGKLRAGQIKKLSERDYLYFRKRTFEWKRPREE